MTIVKPCWANSASQYSARWTHIPAHSPYSPNMHRFHHNFLNPTTSPIITIICKEKRPLSPCTYICVTVMSPSALKNAEDQCWAGSFLKKIKLRWKAATFLFTYTQNLNITMSWFWIFHESDKESGWRFSRQRGWNSDTGCWHLQCHQTTLSPPACFDSLERKWKIVYGRAL